LTINTREYCGYIETIELPINYEIKNKSVVSKNWEKRNGTENKYVSYLLIGFKILRFKITCKGFLK